MKTNPSFVKTQIRSLLTLMCAASASLLIAASPAQAGYIVTLEQVGSNVIATGNGAIDLTGLSFDSPGGGTSRIAPGEGEIITGTLAKASGFAVPIDLYTGISGPTNFGSTFGAFANSGSGDEVGIDGMLNELVVPEGYTSDSPLSDSAIYTNTTFISLGATPGTYEWTWGTGVNQNFTLQIGPAHTPDQGSSLTLLGIVVLCWLGFDLARKRVMRV